MRLQPCPCKCQHCLTRQKWLIFEVQKLLKLCQIFNTDHSSFFLYDYCFVLTRVASVVEAFIDLVSLEKMNGADLYVGKNKKTFIDMKKQEVGDKFPIGN